MGQTTLAVRLCEWCSSELPSIKRPGSRFCDRRCSDAARSFRNRKCGPNRTTACEFCGEKFPETQRPHARYCNRKCKMAAYELRRDKKTPEENAERYQRERKRRKAYAIKYYWEDAERGRETSRAWRQANPDKRHVQHQRRRSRKQAAFVEDVDRKVVFERDDYVCQRCGIDCDATAAWPASNMPTLDHVIALANGGKHSYENSQTLCLSCNCRKGASS